MTFFFKIFLFVLITFQAEDNSFEKMELLTANNWLLIEMESPVPKGWTLQNGIFPSDVILFGQQKLELYDIRNNSSIDFVYEIKADEIFIKNGDGGSFWNIRELKADRLTLSIGEFDFHYVPVIPTRSVSFLQISKTILADVLISNVWEEEMEEEPIGFEFKELNRVLFLDQNVKFGSVDSEFKLMIQSFIIDTYGVPADVFGKEQNVFGWKLGLTNNTIVIKFFDLSSGVSKNFQMLQFEESFFQIGHGLNSFTRRFCKV